MTETESARSPKVASAFAVSRGERWLYADRPLRQSDSTAIDALGLGAYADAIALLMDWKATDTPLTIAINGPWGSGKTSLAEMAEARLPFGSDWGSEHVICKFDAWANDDAPHLGAAFAAGVAKTVNRERHWWIRLLSPLPSVMLTPEQRWRRRLWFWVLAVALAATAVSWPTGGSILTTLLHPHDTVSSLGHGKAVMRLAWPALAIAVIALAQKLGPGVQAVARWIDSPKSEAARGSMQEASRQLARLIRQALRDKRRLVIFVDNLERCRPPRAVEVCEVVSQLIGHKGVVTVLIGDMDTIALSAEIKYAALESISAYRQEIGADGTTGAYGRAYLEKLIQIQISLPPPQRENLHDMLTPDSGTPQAFPAERQNQAFTARVTQRISEFILPRRWALAIGSIGVFTTIATLGADVALSAAGLVGAVISAAAQVLGETYKDYRQNRKRAEIDDAVKNKVDPAETTLRREAAVAKELERHVGKIDAREIRRRMRQRIISENHLRAELDLALLKAMPLSPRSAKRMFNHAHLLLDIGVERGIFAGQSDVSASQLATWVGLTERWPTVAAAITSDTSLAGRLEAIARGREPLNGGERLKAIQAELGVTGVDYALLEYLRGTESLSPVVRLLANFSPEHKSDELPRRLVASAEAVCSSDEPFVNGTSRFERGDLDMARAGSDTPNPETTSMHRSGSTEMLSGLCVGRSLIANNGEPADNNLAGIGEEELYIDGLSALYAERWDVAIRAFNTLLTRGHRTDEMKRRVDEVNRAKELSSLYAAARADSDAGRWADSVAKFETLIDLDPAYRDAHERMGHAQWHQEAAELRAVVAESSSVGSWEAVLDAAERLKKLNPKEPNIDELLSRARASLQTAQHYRSAVLSVDSREWLAAAQELRDIERVRGDYRDSAQLAALVNYRAAAEAPDVRQAAITTGITAPGYLNTAVFNPCYAQMAVCMSRNRIVMTDLNGSRQFTISYPILPGYPSAAFDPAGKRLATASNVSAVRIWDASTGQQVLRISNRHDELFVGGTGTPDLAFSADGCFLAASNGRTARIWDTTNGKLMYVAQHRGKVRCVAFSPDGLLLTAGGDRTVELRQAATGQKVRHLTLETVTECAAFSPDGRVFATGCRGGSVGIYSSVSGAQLLKLEHGKSVLSLTFSPNGRMLATGGHEQGVRIWDCITGTVLLEIPYSGEVRRLSFSPSGEIIAVGGLPCGVEMWQLTADPSSSLASDSLMHQKPVEISLYRPFAARALSVASRLGL